MNPRPFPTVAASPLPAASLRAPMTATPPRETPPDPAPMREEAASAHDITARVSAGIARAVRQRRYTG